MSQAFRSLVGSDLFADSFGYLNGTAEALQTYFAGPNEPTTTKALMLWADTTNRFLWERNEANDGWTFIGLLGVSGRGFLPIAGGRMEGDLNMGGHVIANLKEGSGSAAARVLELDEKAPLIAPLFTGDARVTQDPAGSTSLTRRSWVESAFLPRSGGSLTGNGRITYQQDIIASADGDLVPLFQMRTDTHFDTAVGHEHTGGDAKKVQGKNLGKTLVAGGTAPAGRVLTLDGGTQPDWIELGESLAATSTLLTSEGDTASVWSTINLATLLPDRASVAILQATLNPTIDLFFRKNSSSAEYSIGYGGSGYARFMALVKLVMPGQTFQWKAAGAGSVAALNLVGYF